MIWVKSIFAPKTALLALCAAVLTVTAGSAAWAADSIGEPGRGSGKANPLKNVYFGEQHLHTSASPDAFAVGTRSGWADAYNYALGKPVKLSTTGETMQKTTPYDFVAITDHAEYYGVMPRLIDPKDPLSKTDFGKELQHPSVPASSPKSAVNQILASILSSTGMMQRNYNIEVWNAGACLGAGS